MKKLSEFELARLKHRAYGCGDDFCGYCDGGLGFDAARKAYAEACVDKALWRLLQEAAQDKDMMLAALERATESLREAKEADDKATEVVVSLRNEYVTRGLHISGSVVNPEDDWEFTSERV